MIGDVNVFNPPPDVNARVWRYMDFTKYVALLASRALYFARSDLLGDPFEGSFSRGNEKLRAEIYRDLLEKTPEQYQRIFGGLADIFRWLRLWTFVSSWHQNDYESAAMWKIYAKTDEAIAITTTYRQLRENLPSNVHIGLVEYLDYDNDWLPEGHTLYPFVHKRKSFEHERELRAIIQELPKEGIKLDVPQDRDGISVAVPLEKVLAEVFIAPSAPSWFRDVVADVTKRYGFTLPVRQSSLDAQPFF